MVHYTYTHGEGTGDSNATMHMGQITCVDGTGDNTLTNSTGWVGFRLKYNSGQISNGEFYLTEYQGVIYGTRCKAPDYAEGMLVSVITSFVVTRQKCIQLEEDSKAMHKNIAELFRQP